jgi:hypothetical protein
MGRRLPSSSYFIQGRSFSLAEVKIYHSRLQTSIIPLRYHIIPDFLLTWGATWFCSGAGRSSQAWRVPRHFVKALNLRNRSETVAKSRHRFVEPPRYLTIMKILRAPNPRRREPTALSTMKSNNFVRHAASLTFSHF